MHCVPFPRFSFYGSDTSHFRPVIIEYFSLCNVEILPYTSVQVFLFLFFDVKGIKSKLHILRWVAPKNEISYISHEFNGAGNE